MSTEKRDMIDESNVISLPNNRRHKNVVSY